MHTDDSEDDRPLAEIMRAMSEEQQQDATPTVDSVESHTITDDLEERSPSLTVDEPPKRFSRISSSDDADEADDELVSTSGSESSSEGESDTDASEELSPTRHSPSKVIASQRKSPMKIAISQRKTSSMTDDTSLRKSSPMTGGASLRKSPLKRHVEEAIAKTPSPKKTPPKMRPPVLTVLNSPTTKTPTETKSMRLKAPTPMAHDDSPSPELGATKRPLPLPSRTRPSAIDESDSETEKLTSPQQKVRSRKTKIPQKNTTQRVPYDSDTEEPQVKSTPIRHSIDSILSEPKAEALVDKQLAKPSPRLTMSDAMKVMLQKPLKKKGTHKPGELPKYQPETSTGHAPDRPRYSFMQRLGFGRSLAGMPTKVVEPAPLASIVPVEEQRIETAPPSHKAKKFMQACIAERQQRAAQPSLKLNLGALMKRKRSVVEEEEQQQSDRKSIKALSRTSKSLSKLFKNRFKRRKSRELPDEHAERFQPLRAAKLPKVQIVTPLKLRLPRHIRTELQQRIECERPPEGPSPTESILTSPPPPPLPMFFLSAKQEEEKRRREEEEKSGALKCCTSKTTKCSDFSTSTANAFTFAHGRTDVSKGGHADNQDPPDDERSVGVDETAGGRRQRNRVPYWKGYYFNCAHFIEVLLFSPATPVALFNQAHIQRWWHPLAAILSRRRCQYNRKRRQPPTAISRP